jgi:hypothetical protein
MPLKVFMVKFLPFLGSDVTSELKVLAKDEDECRANMARIYPEYNITEVKEQ